MPKMPNKPPTYRDRYYVYKDQVDSLMGRTRGRWARFKTYFFPNSFSDERKRAIEACEADFAWESLKSKVERSAKQFYQTQNIVGKTVVPGQRPTVYYRSQSGTFGHITQEHDEYEDTGREPPRKHPLYNFGNTGPNGVLEERYGDDVQHKSRSPLILVSTDDEREKLTEAHRIYVHIKKSAWKRLQWSEADRAVLKL